MAEIRDGAEDNLIGTIVEVKSYRTQGYPPDSLARVLGWYGGHIDQPEIVYELEFSDGTTIFMPRDEFNRLGVEDAKRR